LKIERRRVASAFLQKVLTNSSPYLITNNI
jgi:hypothetical protein